jgi:hypothetical protein
MEKPKIGWELSALALFVPRFEPFAAELPSERLRQSQMREIRLKAGKDGYSVGA